MTTRRFLMFIGLPGWLLRVGFTIVCACYEVASKTWARAVDQYDEMWEEG